MIRLVLLEAVPLIGGGVAAARAGRARVVPAARGAAVRGRIPRPVTFALAPAALLLVALGACLVPAFRAAGVDPAEIIREE